MSNKTVSLKLTTLSGLKSLEVRQIFQGMIEMEIIGKNLFLWWVKAEFIVWCLEYNFKFFWTGCFITEPHMWLQSKLEEHVERRAMVSLNACSTIITIADN